MSYFTELPPNDNDNDDDFDWQDDASDDGFSSGADDNSLGFTGDLSWRGSGSDDDDLLSDDDDLSFDWDDLSDGDDGSSGKIGVTDTLNWQQSDPDSTPIPGDGEGWQSEFDDLRDDVGKAVRPSTAELEMEAFLQAAEEIEQAELEEELDWMMDLDDNLEDSQEEYLLTPDIPDTSPAASDSDDSNDDDSLELPSWLAGMELPDELDDLDAFAEPSEDDIEENWLAEEDDFYPESDSFLAGTDELSLDVADSFLAGTDDLNPDVADDFLSGTDELSLDVADSFLAGTDDLNPDVADDFLSGTDELRSDDADDFLTGTGDLEAPGDWLSGNDFQTEDTDFGTGDDWELEGTGEGDDADWLNAYDFDEDASQAEEVPSASTAEEDIDWLNEYDFDTDGQDEQQAQPEIVDSGQDWLDQFEENAEDDAIDVPPLPAASVADVSDGTNDLIPSWLSDFTDELDSPESELPDAQPVSDDDLDFDTFFGDEFEEDSLEDLEILADNFDDSDDLFADEDFADDFDAAADRSADAPDDIDFDALFGDDELDEFDAFEDDESDDLAPAAMAVTADDGAGDFDDLDDLFGDDDFAQDFDAAADRSADAPDDIDFDALFGDDDLDELDDFDEFEDDESDDLAPAAMAVTADDGADDFDDLDDLFGDDNFAQDFDAAADRSADAPDDIDFDALFGDDELDDFDAFEDDESDDLAPAAMAVTADDGAGDFDDLDDLFGDDDFAQDFDAADRSADAPDDIDFDALFGDDDLDELDDFDAFEDDELPAAYVPDDISFDDPFDSDDMIDFDDAPVSTEERDVARSAVEDIDFDSLLEEVAEEEAEDWFAEEDDTGSNMDWLEGIQAEMADENDVPAPVRMDTGELNDFLSDMEDDEFAGNIADDFGALDDLDELSFTDDLDELDDDIESDDAPVPAKIDFAQIFNQSFETDSGSDDDVFDEEVPDWVREMSGQTDVREGMSAAEIIRQQQGRDRPLEDLDERLLALHEDGLNLETTVEETSLSDTRTEVLPDLQKALTPGDVSRSEDTLITKFELSSEQVKRAEMLQMLAGVTTTDAEAGVEDVMAASERRQYQPLWRRIRYDRVLISLALLGIIVLPFFADFDTGDPPPVTFAAGSNSSDAFFRVAALQPGAPVLIAAEYGPTGAEELDSLTQNLMAHVLMQGARPVLVSSNAVGLAHAENLLVEIAGDAGRNKAYFVGGFLPGGATGIRDLSENTNAILAQDSRGLATRLSIETIDDFALVILVAEGYENVRLWMEQVAPNTETPIVLATGYSSLPVILPYVEQVNTVAGLLVGYRDAYTYNAMLQGTGAQSVQYLIPTLKPTNTPTATNTPSPTFTATDTPVFTATFTATFTPTATETVEATATLPPTQTPTPQPTNTFTPSPTETDLPPTPTPTLTATLTETVEPTPEVVTVARVIVADRVNVRTEPNGNIFAQLQPGEVVLVLGLTDAGDWVNIQLADGQVGWVASFLVAVEEASPDALSTPEGDASRQNEVRVAVRRSVPRNGQPPDVSFSPPRQEVTPDADDTDALQLNAESTAEAPFQLEVTAPEMRNREDRWGAITAGTIAAILAIILGNVYYIGRDLLRNERED